MNYHKSPDAIVKMDQIKKGSYVNLNSNDKSIKSDTLLNFVKSITNSSELIVKSMIKQNQVTINGLTITDPTQLVLAGDEVRVGEGHFLRNSTWRAVAI